MNGLQVFNYNDKKVRTVQRSGEPWWVLADVCGALELKNPSKVAARLDEDERAKIDPNQKLGSRSNELITIINEPGLYTVVLRSNKPGAKKFKRWITHEVLPSIRKTGAYATDASQNDHLEALTEEVRRLTETVTAITEQLQKQTPNIMQTKKQFTPGRAALRRWLRTLNEKLDLLEHKYQTTRNDILHTTYSFIEKAFNVLLDEERFKVMERQGFDDCSTIMAIFYNEEHRIYLQNTMDVNLAPENRGW